MGATVKDKNRAVRKEALREFISEQCKVKQVIDIAQKLEDHHIDLEPSAINALKASADIRLKLINKYLPELKATELTGADGEKLIPDAIKIIYMDGE